MVIEGGCLKFGVLFWFSIVFSVLGLFILTVGAVTQAAFVGDFYILDSNFLTSPALLIIIGAVVFLIAFLGCCGAMKESHKLITMFSTLLLVLFVLELAAGIASYIKRGDLENVLEDRLNSTLHEYPNNREIQKTWNIMQHELECCGVNSPDDWLQSGNHTIPSSCCKESPFNPEVNNFECQEKDAFNRGCFPLFLDTLKKKSLILGLSASGIALIQLLMIAFSFSLARAIRKDYQTV